MQGLVGWLRIAILDGAPGKKKSQNLYQGQQSQQVLCVCVCGGGT